MKLININLPSELELKVFSVLSKNTLAFEKNRFECFLFLLKDLDSSSRLELRKSIQKYTTSKVILISDNPSHSLFAWRINAFHFLQYPFTKNSLIGLSKKANEVSKSYSIPKIKIPVKEGFEVVDLNDISFIKGQGDYCTLYIKGRNPVLIAKRIIKFKDSLVHFSGFEVITKSLIVNINHIAKIVSNEAFFLTLPKLKLKLSDSSVSKLKRKLFWID